MGKEPEATWEAIDTNTKVLLETDDGFIVELSKKADGLYSSPDGIKLIMGDKVIGAPTIALALYSGADGVKLLVKGGV